MLFLYLFAMALAVWLLVGPKAVTRAALTGLAIPCLIFLTISGWSQSGSAAAQWSPLEVAVALAIVLFLLYACYVLLIALLRARSVSSETILGAINLYIVFGLMWGLLYAMHEWAMPGAFHISSRTEADAASAPPLATFAYYSFVTQATQGYGDIVPVHPFARSLVILHTIMGQFYLAIVIAYFLGLYTAQEESRG